MSVFCTFTGFPERSVSLLWVTDKGPLQNQEIDGSFRQSCQEDIVETLFLLEIYDWGNICASFQEKSVYSDTLPT